MCPESTLFQQHKSHRHFRIPFTSKCTIESSHSLNSQGAFNVTFDGGLERHVSELCSEYGDKNGGGGHHDNDKHERQ